jgi:hypothetical protein
MKGELSCRRAGFNFFGQRLEIDTARPEFGCEMYEITLDCDQVGPVAKRPECHLYATI